MNLPARPRDGGSRGSAALLVAAVGCAVVLALTGWSRLAGTPESPARGPVGSGTAPSSFALLQMNLCLSGLAGCYDADAYPAAVQDAVARVRETHPDAVTLNEACRRDAVRIARRAGYHLRFSRVIYGGERLRCIDPPGRGLFGDAVLTKAPIVASEDLGFAAQAGLEQRRWLCVTTRPDLDVCTAHLGTRRTGTAATANDAQCAELAALLARRATARTVAFGGDVNRLGSCAPDGFWTRSDASADQQAGVQHVYGTGGALRAPSAEVLPTRHSDHDALLVHARLAQH
ncbi:MAG TPA: endonuclease/exonuclease/phosphatase family protein [Nocardioides sp.]|nr:endonuclease/exonuclease/phosphatase family protein [Nocardioides sp.]